MDYPSILFYLVPGRGNSPQATIYCRITYNGKFRFSTKILVLESNWSQERQTITSRNEVSFRKNKALIQLHADLLRAYDTLSTESHSFTAQDMKKQLDKPLVKEKLSFAELVSAHKNIDQLKDNTYKQYDSVRKLFAMFLKETGRPDEDSLIFCDISLGAVMEFDHYLRTYVRNKVPLKPSTRKEYMNKVARWFSFAKKYAYTSENILEGHSFDKLDKEVMAMEHINRALTTDQCNNISNFSAGIPFNYTMETSKKVFMWQTWTGMSFIDTYNWFKEDRRKTRTISGDQYGTYRRQKTGVEASFIWFDEVEDLFKALIGSDIWNDPSNSAYHTYTYNLVKIAEKVGGISRLSSHDARHIFGNRMLDMGFSMESISKMMGHSSIKETEKVYVKVDINNIYHEFKRNSA